MLTMNCVSRPFIKLLPTKGKKILVNIKIGYRHRSHIKLVASDIVQTFDTVITSVNKQFINLLDWPGKEPAKQILQETKQVLINEGLSSKLIEIEEDAEKAIIKGLESAQAGDLLVILVTPDFALSVIEKYKREKQKVLL